MKISLFILNKKANDILAFLFSTSHPLLNYLKRLFHKGKSATRSLIGYQDEPSFSSLVSHNSLTLLLTLFNFIALCAKLAEIDSKTNAKELNYLLNIFPNFFNKANKVKSIYKDALFDNKDYLFYATKIENTYPEHLKLKQDICHHLLLLAVSDDFLAKEEYVMIKSIADIFRVPESYLKQIMYTIIIPEFTSPYQLLGISESPTTKELNSAYKKMISECHPDILFKQKNVAEEYAELFSKKFIIVNNSYKFIKKMHNL